MVAQQNSKQAAKLQATAMKVLKAHATTQVFADMDWNNVAAKITEIAKQYTYIEFRNSPYSPSNADVLIYFKKQLAALMETQRGTAGATGSGSSSIIFTEEQRSSFFPYSCGN
jgi:hypothetical protein